MQNFILSQIEALEISMTPLEEQVKLSFQEQNQLQIMATFAKYFHNIKEAYLKNSHSKIYEKLLAEYTLLGNSVWSYSKQILSFIQDNYKNIQTKQKSYIFLSHLHYNSQSPLLALYAKIMDNRVRLIGSKKQIERGWANSTIRIMELDKTSAFKSMMTTQGIQVYYIEEGQIEQFEYLKQNQSQKTPTVLNIIDLFNIHATLYRPFFLRQLTNGFLKEQKLGQVNIIYLHPSQIQEVADFIRQTHNESTTIHNLDINISFPHQSSIIRSTKFEDQLLLFLNEELNYPNKQDIIIFHEASDAFIKKVKHMLKKNTVDLLKHIKLVYKHNENTTSCLPPCPSFINKTIASSFTEKGGSNIKSENESVIKQESTESKTMETSQLKNNQSTISMRKPGQAPKNIHTHNSIYIVPNYKTLIDWGYDLSHVFYIFDFRKDETFSYDYQRMAYVETYQQYVTQKQALLRISCMSANKIGKYCYVKENQNDEDIENMKECSPKCSVNDRKVKDIGVYCLEMIEGNFPYFYGQIKEDKFSRDCIKALLQAKIIKQQNEKYVIVNQNVLKCVKKIRDLNPILCSAILSAKNGELQNMAPGKLSLLLTMATSVMMTPGSMRQINNTNAANRPTQIWRQSGYLHSAIDILVRAKIIEDRENSSEGKKSKRSVSRKLSKQTSQQFQVFGNLFEVLTAERITFDQMKVQDLLREQIVNQNFFHRVVYITEKICEVLDLEDCKFSSFEDINMVLADLIKHSSKNVGIYSGSRRVGYFIQGQVNGIFPSKISLLSTLNQRPPFIYITRIAKTEYLNEKSSSQVLMCNSIPQLTLVEAVGLLPNRKTKSYGETQIQYHGVASAVFKNLWKNNGTDIEAFQDRFGCMVQPNEEIALILVHCPKEKENIIKQQFDAVLNRAKQKMAAETKIVHYLGTTSLLLSTGGKVMQVIKDKYINKCSLSNLDLSVQVEDLQELFEEFFSLKDIKLVRQPPSASYKTAYIEFESQKDYYRFYEYYNECKYLDRFMKVFPIQSIPAASALGEEMYLQFTWNAWKSNQKAIVEYENQQMAAKCLESLKSQKLDGKMVKAQIKGNNQIYMEGLNVLTDEFNLEKALENYGKIKLVQILKTPSKQNLKAQETFLQQQIKKALQNPVELVVKGVQKLKNGLRKCRVIYRDENKLNETITKLNQKTGIMGIGRVHIQSWFVYPVKVAHGYLHLYEELVDYTLGKIPNNRIKLQNIIYNEQQYIVARSHLKQQLDLFKQNINMQLQGSLVDLTGFEISILLSEVGIQNLIDLEEKYNCRLIPNFEKKTLTVVSLYQNSKTIKQEIKAKVQDKFFYRIPLNQKSFKHFKQNPELCSNMKSQYHLTQLELEEVGKNLLLEGSANTVEKAFNYLMHVIQSISKPAQEEMLNADVCGICCEEPFRPYRLQQCGHKFCLTCLLDNISMSLGDISMFPIKCPQCLGEVAMVDLDELMTNQMWPQLKNMALNQYVGRNPQIISSCYTAGCKQVNFLIKNYFSCDECQQSYCVECKLNYHPGLTCQQAKEGGNAAFEKYMKENGIRKCPNQSCKMPIMRLDGCYRVTCSRCNKSMCFKCQPDKMIAYDHYNDCYKHLTDVHGGYW